MRVDGSSYTVTTTNNSGSGSLREAVGEAVAASDAAASITFSFANPGQIIQLTSGQLEVSSSSNIFINGSGVIIDGGGAGSSLFFVDSDSTLTITDATLRNVYSENSPGCIDCFGQLTLNSVTMTGCSGNNGGAINLEINSQLTATNCFFADNSALYTGGAVSSMGTMTLIDCTFEDNAADNDGGAVWSEGLMSASGCSFSNNDAAQGYGGAIYAGANTNIFGCTLSFNTAYYDGGAIFVATAFFISNSMTCFQNAAVRTPLLTNDPISASLIHNTTQYNTTQHNTTQRKNSTHPTHTTNHNKIQSNMEKVDVSAGITQHQFLSCSSQR